MTTGIEWTEETWNPATGCSKVSPGCAHCYAELQAERLQKMGKPKYAGGFKYVEHESVLEQPLRWKKPRVIFVNSMSDLFHEDATPDFLQKVFAIMEQTPQHTYQVLTKRPASMAEFLQKWTNNFTKSVPGNIWLGVSVESQEYVGRISTLRMIPCSVRFVSFEPLLGPIEVDLAMIGWAIIGGESGPGFRPMRPAWATRLIRQCEDQGVSVFFKQWGGLRPKSGGRTINGRTYDGFPEVKS